MSTRTGDYDEQDDLYKSVEFAYAFIRERVAKGGKGWKGYPKMREWQLIETAPKGEGVEVVLWHGRPNVGSWMKLWRYDNRYPVGDYWVINGGNVVQPTHWMPIPESPK